MGIIAVAFVALWMSDNAEFIQTSNAQIADGYSWDNVGCQPHEEGLPAITIDSPNGNKWICYKLTK